MVGVSVGLEAIKEQGATRCEREREGVSSDVCYSTEVVQVDAC